LVALSSSALSLSLSLTEFVSWFSLYSLVVWAYHSPIILCSLSQHGGGEMGGMVVVKNGDKQG
jgi:hypothetical protein